MKIIYHIENENRAANSKVEVEDKQEFTIVNMTFPQVAINLLGV